MNKLQTEIKIVGFFCVLVFILGLILPITYPDDMGHAFDKYKGSILSQQIQEYLTWHGRFFTHIWIRIVLQHRFTADLLMSLFNFAMFFVSWKIVQINKTNQPSILWILCISLIVLFTHGLWIALTLATHFLSYRLTFVMLLLFLMPYLKFFADDTSKPTTLWIFYLVSLIAGSTHEQSVVLIPILILMGIIYSYFLKKKLPSWYFLGVFLFFLGYLILFLAPSTTAENRLSGFGGALEWDFFGQKLNWLELGWKRYFYSLAKILYKWIPVTIAPIVFFIVMLIKSIKAQKGFSYNLVPSIVLLVISQAIIVVMMFTPMFYSGGPMSLGMDFLVVGCISILDLYLKIIDYDFKKVEKKISTTVIAITLITWGMQLPPAIQYRLAYNERVHIIREAVKNNQSEVAVKRLPRYGINTPFGHIRMIHPPSTDTFKLYKTHSDLTNINIVIVDD